MVEPANYSMVYQMTIARIEDDQQSITIVA